MVCEGEDMHMQGMTRQLRAESLRAAGLDAGM